MPVAICSFLFGSDKKEIVLTEDEKRRTKRIISAIERLDRAVSAAIPIALIGLAGWAAIWIFRGLGYPAVKAKGKESLAKYCGRTYLIARTFGATTFLAGSLYGLNDSSINSEIIQKWYRLQNEEMVEDKVCTTSTLIQNESFTS